MNGETSWMHLLARNEGKKHFEVVVGDGVNASYNESSISLKVAFSWILEMFFVHLKSI